MTVEVWLIVGRHKDGSIDDEEIGVSGRKALVIIIDGAWHREREQSVRLAFDGAEGFQLLFHSLEVSILLVILIIAFHVEQCVVGSNSDGCIYVAVSIITDKIAMIYPYHPFRTETALELFFYLGFVHRLVAVRSKETHGCGEDGAFAIALY